MGTSANEIDARVPERATHSRGSHRFCLIDLDSEFVSLNSLHRELHHVAPSSAWNVRTIFEVYRTQIMVFQGDD